MMRRHRAHLSKPPSHFHGEANLFQSTGARDKGRCVLGGAAAMLRLQRWVVATWPSP